MNKYKLWCDAGSKGNPGYCYGSYLITGDNNFSQTRSRIRLMDYGTNNQAEYLIMIKALSQLRMDEILDSSLTVFTDSKLLQQQINGNYKVKVAHIKELHRDLELLLNRFSRWTVNWVPREQMVKLFGH